MHPCASQGALKLVTSALSKYRGNQLLRALKAHALDRGGRTQEGLRVSRGRMAWLRCTGPFPACAFDGWLAASVVGWRLGVQHVHDCVHTLRFSHITARLHAAVR